MSSPNTVTACISLSHNDFMVGAPVAAGSVQTCLTTVPVTGMTAGTAVLTRLWQMLHGCSVGHCIQLAASVCRAHMLGTEITATAPDQ